MGSKASPNLYFENQIFLKHGDNQLICGIDEVGRGAWAGPIIVAAVILDLSNICPGINDSKVLSRKKREILYDHIVSSSCFSIASASSVEVDSINVLHATMLAMKRAVKALPSKPGHALVDGNRSPELDEDINVINVIKGDSLCLSIAAASIVAKVFRDRLMKKLAIRYPFYEWEKNAGYGVKNHALAMEKYGITAHHRKSFKSVKKLI